MNEHNSLVQAPNLPDENLRESMFGEVATQGPEALGRDRAGDN